MTGDLDRKDLISLLVGSSPNYSAMDKIPKDFGQYVGGMVDDWQWNHLRESMPYSDEYLYELYLLCKNSWE